MTTPRFAYRNGRLVPFDGKSDGSEQYDTLPKSIQETISRREFNSLPDDERNCYGHTVCLPAPEDRIP